ncbi:hypothetical protein [Phenylobacterium sp.]|uniref:hypothetical protein n=1 Tax=Phenylobacterium sp. TaxID=1871053 RepID=UPI002E37A4DE|nr:hypothetical protein [Phenylobacterium sp.]HEX2559680.1 hypothetical protein [Phenylobacterium sp.]
MTEPHPRGAPARPLDAPTLQARIEHLRQEAQALACDEVEALRATLAAAVQQAQAISDGGDVFPVGIREQARRLSEEIPNVSNTLLALLDRHLRPSPPRRLS